MKTKELEMLSITDKLTGVFNRLRLDELTEKEMGRAIRYGRPLSLVMVDIDKFKNINDTYGHQIGDEALVTFARILKEHCGRRTLSGVGR